MPGFQHWIRTFKLRPGYNDAVDYGVIVERLRLARWKVLGVHHLAPSENRGNHHVFIDVLDKRGKRVQRARVHWTWEGRRPDEPANPILIDKPSNEVPDLPIFPGQVIRIWLPDGESVHGLRANHPREGDGNFMGHHSFLVVFQEADGGLLDPEPEPEPEPGPDPEPAATVEVRVNKVWLDSLPVDEAGNVTFVIDNQRN